MVLAAIAVLIRETALVDGAAQDCEGGKDKNEVHVRLTICAEQKARLRHWVRRGSENMAENKTPMRTLKSYGVIRRGRRGKTMVVFQMLRKGRRDT